MRINLDKWLLVVVVVDVCSRWLMDRCARLRRACHAAFEQQWASFETIGRRRSQSSLHRCQTPLFNVCLHKDKSYRRFQFSQSRAKLPFFPFLPIWPRLTWIWHGPLAPMVGNKFHRSPEHASSSFRPFRVKKMVPVRWRYPTPITSPSSKDGPYSFPKKGLLKRFSPVSLKYASECRFHPRTHGLSS